MMRQLFISLILPLSSLSAEAIWWEGEAPIETNFPKRTWFSPRQAEKDLLSEGDWLTSDKERKGDALFARYRVEVREGGRFQFWVRKMWRHGPFRWRFDGGEWTTSGREVALLDSVYLRKHVPANWVELGYVSLAKGEHTFEIELLAKLGEHTKSAFDAFLLTTETFQPNGKMKPGIKLGLEEKGWFAVEPDVDPFGPGAAFDLRYLNEKTAGQHGFLRVSSAGKLERPDGVSVRLWGVNVSHETASQSHEAIQRMARGLAKRGVNAVRYHAPMFDPKAPEKILPKRLDDLHFLVYALKQEGIYTTLSFYFPLWMKDAEGKHPFGQVFFEPKFQTRYRSWIKQILTAESAYSGLPLAKDPALALVELVNEDSVFFWTFNKDKVPAIHWLHLEELFYDWCERRYGSGEAALQRWGETLE